MVDKFTKCVIVAHSNNQAKGKNMSDNGNNLKNQFLIFVFMSALLFSGCKRNTNKTIIMDIDTVQVKQIAFYGKYLDRLSVLAQNKHGGTYEAWGTAYNGVIRGAERGDWLVIDANRDNHPWGEPNITFKALENLTTGKKDHCYAQCLRFGIQKGQDTIPITNNKGRVIRTVVIRNNTAHRR